MDLIPDNNIARIIIVIVILLLVFLFRNRITGSVSRSGPTDSTTPQNPPEPRQPGGIETLKSTSPEPSVKETGSDDGMDDLNGDPKGTDQKKQL